MSLQEFQVPVYEKVSLDYTPKTFLNKTFIAASKYGYAVKESTTPHSIELAGVGDIAVGVITLGLAYDAGSQIPIGCKMGDLVPGIAGAGDIAVGDKVKPAAGGTWVAAGTAGDHYFGIAETLATAGNIFALRIRPDVIQATDPGFFTNTTNRLYPTTAGDSVQSGDESAVAKVLVMDDNVLSAKGTDTNIPVRIVAKGTGVVTITNGSLTDIPLLPYIKAGQATTGTIATAGQIAVTNLTASGVVIATVAESITLTALAYVVAGTGHFTVFDNTNTEISGVKVNYIVLSL